MMKGPVCTSYGSLVAGCCGVRIANENLLGQICTLLSGVSTCYELTYLMTALLQRNLSIEGTLNKGTSLVRTLSAVPTT